MKLVRFTADWCQPCKQYAPQFDAAASTLQIETDVLDIEENEALVRALNFKGVPSTYLVEDDDASMHHIVTGAVSAPELVTLVNEKIQELG
jgi:thiol-disulfide isomerase/thioredoxin